MRKYFRFIPLLFLFPLIAYSGQTNPANDQTYTVVKVIDGDTLKFSNGERVRLIGVDTPEASNNAKTRRDSERTGQTIQEITGMGKEAAELTRKLVEGKQVRLEFDVQRRDKYGRLLAYIYLIGSKEGLDQSILAHMGFRDNFFGERRKYTTIFLNATLIKAGYAQVMTVPPNVKYQDLFLKLQKEAREQRRGMWG